MNQTVSEQFTTAQVFNTYINNSSIDAHMAKNSEWGATAYLSQSKYGKYGNSGYIGANKQVMRNNCLKKKDSDYEYITGVGADTHGAGASSSTCTSNTYETTKGQAASTTGNITGVYDMSGGADDNVMGVYNQTVASSGFDILPESKYYDNYTTEDAITACNSGVCYGHALSETSGWYGSSSSFVTSSYSWLLRGGMSSTASGIFKFLRFPGGTYGTSSSFRVVLSIV